MFQTTNQYRWCSHQKCPFIGGSIPLLVDKKVPSLGTPLGSLFCTSERPMSTTALPLNSKRMSCPVDQSWCTTWGSLSGSNQHSQRSQESPQWFLSNPSFEPSSFKLRHNETDPWECGPLRPGKCRRVCNKACQGVNSESMSTLVQVGAPWLVYGDYNYIPIRYYKHVSTTYN